MRATLPCVLLLPVLSAQTFVVDAANGPGTNFTSLPAAVAAVPDGATLLVRPGAYAGFALQGRGLTVLGDGAIIQGGISISGTLPTQGVTLRGLSWSAVPQTAVIRLAGCQGPVLLEDIVQPANPFLWICGPPCPLAVGVQATSCPQLYMRGCDIGCTVELLSCGAVLESCNVSGESHASIYITSAPFGNPPRDALTLTDTTAQICGSSTFLGGWGGNLGLGNHVQGGSGIRIHNGSLRLLDGTVLAGLSGLFPPAYTVEPSGAATLRITPRVALAGALGYPTQGPQSGNDVMPALTGSGAAAGGSLAATTTTEPGDLVVLVVGLPGAPVTLPGFVDPFWLDPGAHVFLAIGTQQTATPIGGSIAVPPGPAFVALRLNWQAACFGPVTGSQASNPVVTLVH